MLKRHIDFDTFFANYAKLSNDALQDPPKVDAAGVAQNFAPFFVESSPKGVMGGANDANFRKMVPKGFERYRNAGGKGMRVTGVKVTEIDDANVLAAVDWAFDYKRPKDGTEGTVEFTNRYFLNLAGDTPKIFAYITPDEEQAMKDHGLV